MRAAAFPLLLAFALAAPAAAQVAGTATPFSGASIYVVMTNGQVLKGTPPQQSPPFAWSQIGNVNPPGGSVAGMASLGGSSIWNGTFWFISSAGDLGNFNASLSGGWGLNIFQQTGRPPQTVVAIGSDGATILTAVTSLGDIFRISVNNGISVAYDGNIHGSPTPAQQESIGAIKARYR